MGRKNRSRPSRNSGPKNCPYTGKRRLLSEDEALEELNSTLSSPSARRKEQRYYWCRKCRSYHLTSRS